MVINLQCPATPPQQYRYLFIHPINWQSWFRISWAKVCKIVNLGDTWSKDGAVDGQLLQWTCQSDVGLPSDLRVTVTKKSRRIPFKDYIWYIIILWVITYYNMILNQSEEFAPLRKPLKDEISSDDPFQWWTFQPLKLWWEAFGGAPCKSISWVCTPTL